jgi:hypothetical protein
MVFFSPVMLAGQYSLVTAVTAVSTVTAGVVKDFFMQLFLNPGANMMPVMILCGVVIASCVGLAFLIQKVYEKYCLATTGTHR